MSDSSSLKVSGPQEKLRNESRVFKKGYTTESDKYCGIVRVVSEEKEPQPILD